MGSTTNVGLLVQQVSSGNQGDVGITKGAKR